MSGLNRTQTILIVDDTPQNINLLGELLKNDYQIKVANNGEKALKIATSDETPNLILLDIVMPEMNGYEVCKRLKNDVRSQNIPIIFITGKDAEQDEIKGFKLGAVDYITKPINPAIVKARVSTHLELKRYRDFFENMSLIDGLTGISNRRRFDDYYEMTWELAMREGITHSIIMMDIDFFKAFNDRYGHLAGDECLIQIANRLTIDMKRKTDLVARYGGEEFVCVLPNTSKDDAVMVAEQLRQSIKDLKIPHDASCISDYVTISIGVSTILPIDGMISTALINAADEALYSSKKNGRDLVTHFDSMED